MKIWAKLLTDGRITSQTVYEKDGKIIWSHMHEYLTEICYALDIPTPVILKSHVMNLAKFNHVKFKVTDFVESIDFDCLFLENLSDK